MAAEQTPRRRVVIDGSNIATEGRAMPSLAQLEDAISAFMDEFRGFATEDVIVVVDATFGHRIDASERARFDDAVAHGEMVTPPAGAVGRGDGFILRIAEKSGALVLSNDSFQEFHAERPWLFDPGRLIGGKPVPGVGWIFTPRTPVRGPTSRAVMSRSRRTTKAETGGGAEVPEAGEGTTAGTAAKTTKAVKSEKATKAETAAKTTKAVKSEKATKATKTAKATKATKTAKATGAAAGAGMEVAETGVEVPGAAEGEAVATPETAAKATKATKTAKATKATKATKAAKATKVAKATKATAKAATATKATAKAATATKATAKAAPARATAPAPPTTPEAAEEAAPAAGPVANDALTFLTFVADHAVGSTVEGTVAAYTSHGARIDVGDMHCHVPLRGLGDPPPRRARGIVTKGETRPFVVVGFDAGHRRAELALPEVAADR